MSYLRATRVLMTLMGLAFVVSVVHYYDITVHDDAFPGPGAGSVAPDPSRHVLAGAWFVFTAFGALGIALWLRRRITTASVAVGIYSLCGLIGLGRYAVPGATDLVWWRQAHTAADICCGAALLGFAVWAARHANDLTAPATLP